MGFDEEIAAGKEDGLVTVIEPDLVWRPPISAPDLEDLAVPV